jgi:hypothetical protein
MSFPLMTLELARRMDQVFAFHTEISVKILREEEGNPFAIENKRFGHATAYTMGAWPDSWYHNRASGSQRNLERAGLRLAYNTAVWQERKEAENGRTGN